MRRPLPLRSNSPPSGLNMRKGTGNSGAVSPGTAPTTTIPSAPTPRRRRQIRRTADTLSTKPGPSSKTK